jgi:hypothetical protein
LDRLPDRPRDVLATSIVPAALKDLWVGPFVGGRLCWDVNQKLAFGVGGDVGGLEIGSAFSLIRQFSAGIDYWLAVSVN